MKYASYSTAAACGALLCAAVICVGSAGAAVDSHAGDAAAKLENAATAIQQSTSGKVLKIQVDKGQPGAAYDAVVDVNGHVQAMELQGASVRPVMGPMPSWAYGYTPHVAKDFQDTKLNINQAIDIAMRDNMGVPIAAEFKQDMNGSIAVYKVAFAEHGGRDQMLIDAKSGSTIPNDGVIDFKP